MNALTSGAGGARRSRLPMVMEDDAAAVLAAVTMSGRRDWSELRLARIKDTLSPNELMVTPALLTEAGDRFDLEITGTARDLTDATGSLTLERRMNLREAHALLADRGWSARLGTSRRRDGSATERRTRWRSLAAKGPAVMADRARRGVDPWRDRPPGLAGQRRDDADRRRDRRDAHARRRSTRSRSASSSGRAAPGTSAARPRSRPPSAELPAAMRWLPRRCVTRTARSSSVFAACWSAISAYWSCSVS